MKPVIAVTLGDPAGVGPEIVARVAADPEVAAKAELLLVGGRHALAAGATAAGAPLPAAPLVEAGPDQPAHFGAPSAQSGAAAGAAVEKAFELVKSGRAAAMATAPISKEALQAAGYPDTGHTTMLSRLCEVPRPVMMLAGDRLKVVLVTIHCSLLEVFNRLTAEAIEQTAQVTHQAFERLLEIKRPHLAVAALNPHAGEGGMFGSEEQTIISPAIQNLKKAGINVTGPYPPDTLFWRASRGEFDAVVCMYHDQGLIPLKLLHFEDAVNVTLGLPIIRTSVDHGTGYDIAGQGQASPKSLKQAVLLAAKMAAAQLRERGSE